MFCALVLLHAPDWCLAPRTRHGSLPSMRAPSSLAFRNEGGSSSHFLELGVGTGNTTLPCRTRADIPSPCRVTRRCPSQPGRTAQPRSFAVSTASWGPDVLAPPTVVVGVATGGHIYAAGSSGAICACCHWTAQALPLLLAGLGRDMLPLLVTAVGLWPCLCMAFLATIDCRGLGLAHCRRRRGIALPLLFDVLLDVKLLLLLDGDADCTAAACVFGWGGTGVVKRRVDGYKGWRSIRRSLHPAPVVVYIERHSSQSYRAARRAPSHPVHAACW
ncbi:hypothetical protein C8J57DRAFT_1519431 [Mycena rebaudengoi]|nr:hypothetical protein C8J57DRAFT_1519431 [Mycena rebaudengoi]